LVGLWGNHRICIFYRILWGVNAGVKVHHRPDT
jgi:hypothetical protein